MGSIVEEVHRAKARMDEAVKAALRGEWLDAEQALRDVQMGAREMRLLMLSRRLEVESAISGAIVKVHTKLTATSWDPSGFLSDGE